MPKSRLGKWSVGLIVVFFLLFATLQLLVASGQRGGNTFFDNPVLAFTGIGMGIAGVLAFFTGIAGIMRYKERNVFLFLSIAIGLFVLTFWLGEILSPH